MKTLLLIAIGSAIVNNVVLSQFLGICPFLGVPWCIKENKHSCRNGWRSCIRYHDLFVRDSADLQIYPCQQLSDEQGH